MNNIIINKTTEANCAIVSDLLPLYHDGVASPESATFVRDHLIACASCQTELGVMDKTIVGANFQSNLSEAQQVTHLAGKWRSGMRRSIVRGALITLAVIASALLLLYTFVGVRLTF
jgi:predicted anti-sigma-YlaC factor YlaD